MPFIRHFCAGLALLLTSAGVAAAAPAVGYQPFPPGYGYAEPAEIAALKAALKRHDSAVLRDHGWRLWAGSMQPAAGRDWPVWSTWPTTTQAFAAPAVSAPASAGCPHALQQTQRMGRLGQTTIPVETPDQPEYDLPDAVKRKFSAVIDECSKPPSIRDGAHFAFNGDIMIATESLSQEAFDFLRDPRQPVYQGATLDQLHQRRVHQLVAPLRYVVTKHMYWPVKAEGLTALPVWHEDFGPDFPGYAGYETWRDAVAIDPSGKMVGRTAQVSYLYDVWKTKNKTRTGKWPTQQRQARVVGLQDFYHHRVTQADWDSFDEADRAILNAASYWLSNKPFGVGDYLVTVAMHINTKEVPSWALQSVWWSDRPDSTRYAANRPAGLRAAGPWAHYLMTESYGVPEKTDPQMLPVATNPYIELVSHPVGTSCTTCHARAGWPKQQHGYQNPGCPNLRLRLDPNSKCLKELTLTDFQWIIPDRALAAPAPASRP